MKRNRLAAHNSRERKRQEVDHLQKRNDLLEAHVVLMQRTIDAYKAQFPDAQVPSVPVLPQMEKINFDNVDSPSTTYNDNFASEPSPRQPQQPRQPLQPIYNNHYMAEMSTPAPFSSPETLLSGFDSPVDTAPSTPGTSVMGRADMTQQSAALLCKDPQCQSVSSNPSTLAAMKITANSLSAINSNIPSSSTSTMAMHSKTSPSTRKTQTPSATRIPSSTRALTALQIAKAFPVVTRAMRLNCSMLTTSLICRLGLARLTAATPQALRSKRLSAIKRQRQQMLVPSGMTSAELTTRIAASLGNRSQARIASHHRRSDRIMVLKCNCSLTCDIKGSTQSLTRALDGHNKTWKILLALEEAEDFKSGLVGLQCVSRRIVKLLRPQYYLHSYDMITFLSTSHLD